jgi:SAM-dependent methyltransferase
MTELIAKLPRGARVLDLGAGAGSFSTKRRDIVVVRLDLEPQRGGGSRSGAWVAGDAARMPFASGCFDLIIANHSLEHCAPLEETVREMGRVLRQNGRLYIAVPDAATLTDRIYRWMARGGGHVNPFYKPEQVAGLVERLAGVPHRGTKVLFSSLSFLNRHNFKARPPMKIALFAFGSEHFLAVFTWLLRQWDLGHGTRWSRYGWAFYFGGEPLAGRPEAWINVCVRCGSGHAQAFLKATGAVRWFPRRFQPYRCPLCGAWNLFTEDVVFF